MKLPAFDMPIGDQKLLCKSLAFEEAGSVIGGIWQRLRLYQLPAPQAVLNFGRFGFLHFVVLCSSLELKPALILLKVIANLDTADDKFSCQGLDPTFVSPGALSASRVVAEEASTSFMSRWQRGQTFALALIRLSQ